MSKSFRFPSRPVSPPNNPLSATVAVLVTVLLTAASAQPAAAQQGARANRMIEALEAGRPAIAGLDFQVVEAEHKTFVVTEVVDSIRIALEKKNSQGQPVLAPIVRLPMEADENSGWAIKAILEGGAMGIIIPHTETSDQALRVIRQIRPWNTRDTKYPFPAGHRSGGGSAKWGVKDLSKDAGDLWPLNPNGDVLFFPMIETAVGLANLLEILETPGVSGILVGPTDLAGSLGLGGSWPPPAEAEQAIERIGAICRERDKYCGMVGSGEDATKRWLDAGFRFMWRLDLPDATAGNWYAQQYNR